MTFSQHAATSRWSKIYYSLLFLTTLPLLMWFFIAWFVPHKHVPTVFLWFATISVVFQMLCTWFPEEGGAKTRIHRLLTGISGIAMLPVVGIIVTSASTSTWVRAMAWVGLLLMLGLLGIALKNRKGFRWALLLQIGYYGIFFVILGLVTYF